MHNGEYLPLVVIWYTGTRAWMTLPSLRACSFMGKYPAAMCTHAVRVCFKHCCVRHHLWIFIQVEDVCTMTGRPRLRFCYARADHKPKIMVVW